MQYDDDGGDDDDGGCGGDDDYDGDGDQGLSQQGVRVSFWHPGPRKMPILGGKRHPIIWSEIFENINYK